MRTARPTPTLDIAECFVRYIRYKSWFKTVDITDSCCRKSYLDVSRKIALKQLGMMLPGDARSAWKSPREY